MQKDIPMLYFLCLGRNDSDLKEVEGFINRDYPHYKECLLKDDGNGDLFLRTEKGVLFKVEEKEFFFKVDKEKYAMRMRKILTQNLI